MEKISLSIQEAPALGLSINNEQKTLGLGLVRTAGTTDYEVLENKPSIEGHVLIGDSTLPEIGVEDITPQDIDKLIYG